PPGLGHDPSRERQPVPGHPHIDEATAAAQRAQLAAREEVVGRPVALVAPERGPPIRRRVLAEQTSDPAQVVVRLDEEETAAGTNDTPERREDFGAAMEMGQALQHERAVD